MEKDLEAKLIRACKKKSIKTIKGDSRNNIGYPDRIIFNHIIKEIHFVELKFGTYYKQTVPQLEWQLIIQKSGGKYFLIEGEEQLKEYIKKYIEV
jgi:hypothetical protein